jgi:long-chain fatty acid transport protein
MKNQTTALLLAATLPSTVFGLGFRLTDQDPFATARGGAFVATADNPSAIYYNPAGISQLEGTHSLMSAYVIGYRATIEPDGSDSEFGSKWNPGIVPHSFYTLQPKNSPLTLGLGFYSPFGLGFQYDNNTPFRTQAIKGELMYVTASPVAAWKFNDQLSIAAGPMINWSRAFFSNGIFTPGDEFKFKGTGVSFGFVAGLLYQPTPKHSFGVAYHSSSNLTYSGHTHVHIPDFKVPIPGVGSVTVPGQDFEDDADASLTFPQTIQAGYSFRPAPDWNFEFDIEWTDWDSLNTATIHQSRGLDIKVPFKYRSSFLYDFGVTKKFSNGMHVSLGYIYSENSVPNEYTTPLVPDTDRHVFSVGVGGVLGKYTWDIAYQYAYGPSRHVSNGTSASGDYHFESNAVSVSLGHEF